MDNVLLKAPRWSVFPNGERRVTSLRAGKITPIYFNLLGTGDQISLQHNLLLRLAPMLTPAMADIECDVDFFAVPFGVLYGIDIYDDFIVDSNNFGDSFPSYYLDLTKANSLNSVLGLSGNLFDYFNLSSFFSLFSFMFDSVMSYTKIAYNNETTDINNWSGISWDEVNPSNQIGNSLFFPSFGSVSSFDGTISDTGYTRIFRPLVGYCYFYYLNGSFTDTSGGDSLSFSQFKEYYPDFDTFISASGFRTVQSFYDSLQASLIPVFFNYPVIVSHYGLSGVWRCPSFFTDSYHKIIADWYLNTQVVDPDSYLSDHLFSSGQDVDLASSDKRPFDAFYRFYPDDYFTGCVPNSQVGSAVQIPADTTVLELANLTALQRMLLRSGYVGIKRFKDFARGFFGVNPSNQKLMFSEFIGRKTYRVQINDVAQTSESSSNSVLASYSGRGISWGKNGGFKYFADVPTAIVGLASVRVKTVYDGVVDPFCKVTKTSDFILPDLESVGNEAIYLDELTGNPADSETVFGWNRRYYRWTRRPSVVTGAMRTYLHSWNAARSTLREKPVYNQDWLTIHPEDGIDNIFGVADVDNFYCDFRFDVKVSRPLSRYLHLHI